MDPMYKENAHDFVFTAPNVTKWLKTSPQNKRIAEIRKEAADVSRGTAEGLERSYVELLVWEFKITECILFLQETLF